VDKAIVNAQAFATEVVEILEGQTDAT